MDTLGTFPKSMGHNEVQSDVDERVKLVRAKLEWNIKYHTQKLEGYKKTLDLVKERPYDDSILSVAEMVVKS